MNPMIQTERCILREMQQSDIDDVACILQNPNVMYAYEHTFSTQDVQEWLDRQRLRYQRDGFGLWAVILKSTGQMIGQAGLTYQHYQNKQILEIGYLLKEAYWHQGYAREAAASCQHYAFNVLEQNVVHSIIKVDNAASIRVALSIGMVKEAEFYAEYYHGPMLHALYTLRK